MALKRYWAPILRLFLSEADKVPLSELRGYFVTCLMARVGLVTAMLTVSSWGILNNASAQSHRGSVGFMIIGVVLAISALQALALKRIGVNKSLAYTQFATDLLLASVVFGFSQSQGGTFLYLLVIASAAGIWRLRGALIVATLSSILYSFIQSGLMPGLSGMPGVQTYEILLYHLSFIFVALFSSFLATYLGTLKTLTRSQAENVRQLMEREEQLLSDLSRAKALEEKLSFHETVTQLLANKFNTDPKLQGKKIAIIGESPMMKNLFMLVERVASSDASVLITGESGTGKELIARAIHEISPRSSKPFVAINCGAIPENLIESELFGHKRGAFTGAVSDNIGLFRRAQGGTLLLDEIGELPQAMQTKLLRALQERVIRAVGDVNDVAVDVRVVAATNKDLKREINAGRFREDLYYRLNVVNLLVPPLRDRKDDLPLLIRHFLTRYAGEDAVVPSISPEALQCLRNYPFPGNIRELENVIERALVLGGSAVLPEHLPDDILKNRHNVPSINPSQNPETQIIELPLDLDAVLSKFEHHMLIKALEHTGGMKKQAAELLGLNFRSFRYRLKKYGMGGDGDAEGGL